MPTKKPKTKQKQKQKQRQTVIVNVNQRASTRRRGTPRRRSGGGGGGGIPYPVYLNSPNDYAPIIHNVLPSTLQASIPTNTMMTTPLVNTVPIPHIPASTLQTNDAVNIPLIKKISNIPSRSGGISIAELKNVLNTPSKGLKSIDSRQTKSLEGEFFAPPTRTLSSYPSSISIMSDITTPNELIGNIPRARNQDLTGMTPQQKYQRQQQQTTELNKSKKIAKTQQPTFKL